MAMSSCARARAVMDEAKDEDEGFEYSSRIALGVHSLARIRARGTGNVCGVRSMCGANGGGMVKKNVRLTIVCAFVVM